MVPLKSASSVLPSVTAGYFNPPRHRAHGNFSSLDNSGKSAWSDIIKTKASKAARSSVRYRADVCAWCGAERGTRQQPRLRPLENVERDCVPHHAVLIAPGLRLGSPKNGNISNVGRRLSAISLPSCSNWEYRDGQKIHKRPQLAGTYRISWATISS